MPHLNSMRSCRKRSRLTQSDIAFLLDIEDHTNLSRCEKGQRAPFVDMMLLYHLLFSKSIEQFFEPHVASLRERVLPRMEELVRMIQGLDESPRNEDRVRFLADVLSRLGSAGV